MNNNGDGKIPMIGQEKRDKWKRKNPAGTAGSYIVPGIDARESAGRKAITWTNFLSFELANARYNPWIVPTQPEGRLAKFVNEEIRGQCRRDSGESEKYSNRCA